MTDSDLRISHLGDLRGFVAFVTGGGTGLGLIITRAFASNGAKVYIGGRRMEKLESAARTPLPENSGEIIPLQLDITSKEGIATAVERIKNNDGKLDILVNNAGALGSFYPDYSEVPAESPAERLGTTVFRDDTFESWERIYRTNTIAPFMLTSAFLELLTKGAVARNSTSSVVNISSSTTAVNCAFTSVAYKTSKIGLEGMTQSLATEYALNNIPVRVNVLSPGIFYTDMAEPIIQYTNNGVNPMSGALRGVPMKRLGRDKELAIAALFLAGEAGSYTNGQIVRVDGGLAAVNP